MPKGQSGEESSSEEDPRHADKRGHPKLEKKSSEVTPSQLSMESASSSSTDEDLSDGDEKIRESLKAKIKSKVRDKDDTPGTRRSKLLQSGERPVKKELKKKESIPENKRKGFNRRGSIGKHSFSP